MLALLKLRIPYERILGMTEREALAWLEAWEEMVNGGKSGKTVSRPGKVYTVRRKG